MDALTVHAGAALERGSTESWRLVTTHEASLAVSQARENDFYELAHVRDYTYEAWLRSKRWGAAARECPRRACSTPLCAENYVCPLCAEIFFGPPSERPWRKGQ